MKRLSYRHVSITGSKISDKKLLKVIVMASVLLCIGHLLLGSNVVVVTIAFIIMIIGVVPIATTGSLRIGALLVLFVAFRYVDFAAMVKFLMLQPIDSNLHQPITKNLSPQLIRRWMCSAGNTDGIHCRKMPCPQIFPGPKQQKNI